MRDPWQSTRFVHLIDIRCSTAEVLFTHAPVLGGRDCVINLADQIKRMRGKHPDAVPVVELGAAPITTRFGKRSQANAEGCWLADRRHQRGDATGSSDSATHAGRQEMDDEIPW